MSLLLCIGIACIRCQHPQMSYLEKLGSRGTVSNYFAPLSDLEFFRKSSQT